MTITILTLALSAIGCIIWLSTETGAVSLHGFDSGVGFVTVHNHERGITSRLCVTRPEALGR